jgi:O-antigen/teichoic acid export membrane protein
MHRESAVDSKAGVEKGRSNRGVQVGLKVNAKQISGPDGTPILAVIARNSVANLVKMAILSLTAFLLPPLLVRVLDKPSYATWLLILQIGTYVALFDATIQTAISRFVARAHELRDHHNLAEMLSSAGVINLCGGVFTALVTILGYWQLHRIFPSIPSSISNDARTALLVFGFSLAISLPFSTVAGAFLGFQMNQVNALAGSVGRLAGAAGAAWAAYRHHHLYVMAAWMASGNLLQAVLFLLAWLQLKRPGLLRWTLVTRAAMREFAYFSYALFAMQFGSILISGLDLPIVAMFDFRSAAYYAIAATASNMLSVPQTAVVSTLIPVASGISAAQDSRRLGQAVLKTTRYAVAILCLLALPLLLGMHPFLRIWVGSDYAQHAVPMAYLLVVAQFVRLTFMPYVTIGFGAGQPDRMLISPLGEGVVNLAFSLLGAYFLGAIGVALGTLIGAFAGILLHIFCSMPKTDSMSFSRGRFILSGILRPVACYLAVLLPALLIIRRESNLAAQLAIVGVTELFVFAALWIFNFTAPERAEIVGLLTRKQMALGFSRVKS